MSGGIAFAAVPRLDGSEGDGVHLLWTAPPGAGYSLDGWDIERRKAVGRPKVECYALSYDEIEALHRVLRVHTPLADFAVREAACPVPPTPTPETDGPPPVAAAAQGPGCIAYEITLPTGHREVQVRTGVPVVLAVAMRAGKAVAARPSDDSAGTHTASFENLDVDRVILYCRSTTRSLELCVDILPSPKDEDASWSGAELVVKGIQIPIRALDAALTSQADEDALASSRLLASEQFDADSFHNVTELMNVAAADAQDQAPVYASTVERDDLGDPFIEVSSWSYALSLLIDPAWRRMLGFGFLDRAANLEPGQAYDYRLIGRFRRRDVGERLYGFHSVPRGTMLPNTFPFGSLLLRTPESAVVQQLPEPSQDALSSTGRKGIALAGSPCLTLSFAQPVARVALELAPGAQLTWRATTTEFLVGLTQQVFEGVLPAERRVTIETGDPVDTIEISGTSFLYGIRELPAQPVENPDDVVTLSAVRYGVVFADTPLPDPPPYLDTVNLQEPSVPLDPASGPPPAPESLGFRLSWIPPPGPGGPVPWPPDLAAYPPFDALGFRLQRRRVDTSGAYEQLDGAGMSTLVLGSRGGRRDSTPLRPGVDLEAVFPTAPQPVPPVSPLMTLDDVLVTADHAGPPPGSTHEYRIFSVDAIGRASANAREGPVVRLEKHQPPPQPVGPPAPPAGALPTAGVAARVLQADDAELPPGDRALLGPTTNAVVLQWGWTDVERNKDPHASEFRVYWQPLPPDVVAGEVTGPPVLSGGLFELPATLDRPLPADAMKGRYLALPDYPFKVASHTPGQSITLVVEPSALDSSRVPAPAAFEFHPVLTGAEQRPPAWAERSAVVPLTDADSYEYVFRDRLVLDAEHARSRVWVGVSCADDQTYVADALPAAVLNGGRTGNESAVAASAATARYLGRPELTVPPPLPDVPELVTREPVGDTVSVDVDLSGLLPGVTIPAGHRVLVERIGLDRVVACMSAQADGSIGASLPDGTAASYAQPNPGDQAALLEQIRTATPARVEGRFLVDFLIRFAPQLESLWAAALAEPVAFGSVPDTLPRKAERYVHCIRLVDAAGHRSAGAAIAPQIVRVPSLRSPAPPQVVAPSSEDDTLAVEARVLDAFDLSWVVLFAEVTDAGVPADGNLRSPAQLLRLPSRRDLYPLDGIRVRLADGTLLEPMTALDVAAGAVELPDRVLTTTLTPGHTRRVALWSVAMTRDGIPSRLSGPLVALTGEPPLVVPTLTVTTSAGVSSAHWTALAVPALLALERSLDGGTSWSQVSPWLDAGITSYELRAAAGDVRYRVTLRASRGRRATGPEVPA
jgi:hypothetical protein